MRVPRARAFGRRRVADVAIPLLVIAAVALELVLASGCCKTPRPAAPVVVTEPARCLEGVEPPTPPAIEASECAGPLVLCFDFRGAAELEAQRRAWRRYRDQVEGRCRPRHQARQPKETP